MYREGGERVDQVSFSTSGPVKIFSLNLNKHGTSRILPVTMQDAHYDCPWARFQHSALCEAQLESHPKQATNGYCINSPVSPKLPIRILSSHMMALYMKVKCVLL